MKKLYLALFSSVLLASCSSIKYQISDEKVKEWIGISNDLEQCLYPFLTNPASYSLLPDIESKVLVNYVYHDLLSQIIGGYNYNILQSDKESYSYFKQKHDKFNNYIKANVLTPQQCEAYKYKFNQDVALYKQKQAQEQQEQENLRQAQMREEKARQEFLQTPQGQAYLAQQEQNRARLIQGILQPRSNVGVVIFNNQR